MKQKKKMDQCKMKIENRKAVMEQIKQEDHVSRADLAKKLYMSPTSMTRICGDVLELGLIREIQSDTGSSVGRKAMWVQKDPEAFYSLGILIRRDFISFIVIDYDKQIRFEKQWKEEVGDQPKDVIQSIGKHIKEIQLNESEVFSKVEAVGVSFPGIVDEEGRNIRYSDLFGWKNISFVKYLEEEIKIPCYLARDIKASIIEEFHAGGMQENSLGFLSLSQEIGAAFLYHGEVIYGADGICGEIAHKTVVWNGRDCKCGRRGCADAYLSEKALLQRAKEKGASCQKLSEIADAYQIKESWADELLQESADIITLLIEDMIAWNNPERIILGGRTVRYFPEIIQMVRKRMRQDLSDISAGTEMIASRNAGNESMLGAAYIAMDANETAKIYL